MFHPLLPSFAELKDADLEAKINELMKKYSIALRTGNGGLCSQVALAIEAYKEEYSRRQIEKTIVTVNKQDRNLDDLINVN